LQIVFHDSTIRYIMTPSDKSATAKNESRTLIIVVAIIAALVIAVLFYFLMRATGGGTVTPTLQGAIRPGSAEFERVRERIVLDEPVADEGKRALGDIVMTLSTTVRNFSGKTLSGLEIKGAVIDHQNQPVKQRTIVIIPSPAPGGIQELAPNKTIVARVVLDGMTDTDDRANIKMEVTGIKFKD
jgi:hypothetical protein